MFNLYLGKKYKHIRLDNGYILSATLTTKIDEPLSLAIDIDIAELYRTQSKAVVDYLVRFDTIMYLECRDLNIGYKFTKKHNQCQQVRLLGKDGNNILKVTGNEFLPQNGEVSFSSQTAQTINGPSLDLTQYNIINNSETLTETRIFADSKSSQNMVNDLVKEEISISGQVLENDILKLVLFSSLNQVNYKPSNLVYGSEYINAPLVNVLSQIAPNYDIITDLNLIVNYKVELKHNLEILNEVTKGYNIIDNGYNLKTDRPSFIVQDTLKQTKPKVRFVSQTLNQTNPFVITVRENYPSLSAQVVFNNHYVREGTLAMLKYNTRHTNYNSNFIVQGTSIDLYLGYSGDSNVQLLRTNQDIRRNYLQQNLQTLSQRIIY
jgi:hypothetical protein